MGVVNVVQPIKKRLTLNRFYFVSIFLLSSKLPSRKDGTRKY